VSDGMPDFRKIARSAGGFSPRAIQFIHEGLAHTVKLTHGDNIPAEEDRRHVNGRQLCMGLRDYAIRQYGRMARAVLRHWGIESTEDFGRLVFAMVDAQLLRKTPEDSMEDFRSVYDFDEAFEDLTISR
jgi:uncharacterized repeat protein (TIGR04138 family)